jgi:hypothetical protein
MYTFQGPFGLSLTFNLDCMQYMDSGKIILRLKVGVSMESRIMAYDVLRVHNSRLRAWKTLATYTIL